MSDTLEGLNLIGYMASGINKNDGKFQALFSDPEGEGALANELEELVDFIRYYITTDDVANHKGDSLDQIIQLFAKLDRYIGESDTPYLRRMQSLTQRKGDTIWGTKWNIIHVFETYFAGRRIYLCENTAQIDQNMITNGDFEEAGMWTLTGDGAEINVEARFSKDQGLSLIGTGDCSQTVTGIASGVYIFHFFLMGKCGVRVLKNDGKYWNAKTLAWSDSPVSNTFNNILWDNVFFFIKVPENTELNFTFLWTEGTGYVDYVRLFKKEPYPTFTLVVNHEGYNVTNRTLHMAAGREDPYEEIPDYTKESYYDKSFLVGSESSYTHEIYQEILDVVRPRGIRAFVEFAERAAE
jgi:hypothetical protein